MLFQKKHAKENEVFDLSALPPFRNVFQIHSEKNFVAKVWRSLKNKIDEVSSANHGWNEYGMTFGGLTKHFLMILVEYFLIIYTMMNNLILEAIMKKVRTKTEIKTTVTL